MSPAVDIHADGEALILGIRGWIVDTIRIDRQLTLAFVRETYSGARAELAMSTAGDLTFETGRAKRLLPQEPDSLAAILPLLRRSVLRARVMSDGLLELHLGSAVLRIAPDVDYEAWTFADDAGVRLVALPGGGVAEWDP